MKRRIIAALAALGLTATMAVGLAPAAQAADPVDYVALGDSVAGGNGLLPYIADDGCLQSKKKSYPMQLAKSLGLSAVTRACSGASTLAVGTVQLPAAVASGALGPATELVTLTVGVNDVQWAGGSWGSAVIACSNEINPIDCSTALYLALGSLTALPGLTPPAVPLNDRITMLVGAIRAAAPNAEIVVTGYPFFFGDFTGTCGTGLLDRPEAGIRTPLTYSPDEAQQVDQATGVANGLIAQGVLASGDPKALYVDVNGAVPGVASFDGHGFCDTGDAWISGLMPSTAKPVDRGFHPNAPGQAAYAAIIAQALALAP
ncbi:SGNH/GDSL hydrolase family protein [Microbacterium sp. SS28]|uniref:SGNH/GDSL hydrolase family protein n=1 Tax=Microbacterium sp. SS28 TaxID=2919948 RepID=UPI001FAA376C|nr:SGNH/GDSL hydrolase family protein [Microbacterium sp. SS28]